MKKDRDWIDYANLATNLAQNFQLYQTNKTLEGLERVATERVIREQEQRDQERRLDQLREHVSQIADDVVHLQEHLRENPCAALALGLQIKGLLEKHNVTTASFKAWEDKDRLKSVVIGLEAVRKESTSLLTKQQREDAAKCAKYLAERDALNQLISLQRMREVFDLGRQQFEKQLTTKRTELMKLKGEHSGIRLPVWQRVCMAVGGLGLAFSMVWLLGVFLSQPLDTGDFPWSPKPTPAEPPLSVPGAVTFVVFIISLISTAVALSATARLHQKKVTKQIQTLETEIAKLQAELERYDLNSPIKRQQYLELGLPDFKRIGEQIGIERGELSQSRATHQRWEELTAMFGVDRSAEQYEAMKREREEFNETIFGESEAAPERRLSDDERLIEQSIQIIRRENVASTSVLQRRLRVGYESAIQILDELERRGIVGPSKGAEPRDIISN